MSDDIPMIRMKVFLRHTLALDAVAIALMLLAEMEGWEVFAGAAIASVATLVVGAHKEPEQQR